MSYRFLLFFAAATAAALHADVRATVVDPHDNPIEGVRVSCGGKTAVTSTAGIFTIPGTSACRATISKAGFATTTVDLTATEAPRITMPLQAATEVVVVTATRTETTPERAGVAASVIPEREIQARDHVPVPDLLREIAGLQVVASGGPGTLTSVYTRGAERTGTLVLLDGVPVNDPGGEINLAHVSSEGLERIEVVRGPESALFGAEAAAGVIQLFTKRGNPEAIVPHGSVEYEHGNFGTDRWLASLAGGSGARLDYALSAAQLHTGGEYANSFYRDTTGTANIGWRFSDATTARGIFREYDAHVGTPGQIAFGPPDTTANELTRNSTVSLSVDDARGAHFLQHAAFGYNRLSDGFNSSLNDVVPVAGLVRDVPGALPRTYFVSLANPTGPVPPGLRLVPSAVYFFPDDSLNITERRSANYQGTWAQSAGALVFGYEYQRQSGDLSGTAASRDHNGLFVNEQKTFGGRLSVSAGFRVEHSSAFGTEFVPRAAASYRLFSTTYLRASAGRGITEPSLYENFVQSEFFHGNPALRPEKTNSYEAGLVQEWAHGRVRTEVSAFRSSFTNLIAFVVDSWQNVQASWARGVETSIEARLPGALAVRADYTRLYTRITSSTSPDSPITGIGEELARRARNSGAVMVSWLPHRWSLVTGARFIGDRQDADFTFGANRNPGYENVFVSASFDITKHITPVLRGDNLLNERYQEALGYPALSRTLIGGLRLHW